jgi:outer membrane protein
MKYLILFLIFQNFQTFAVTLDEAFQASLKKNEDVQQANEQVIQSEEHLSQAKSTIFPNLSFNASYMVQPEPKDPVAQQFFEKEQTSSSFTLRQPLFKGFREYAGIRQRKNLIQSQKQNRIATLLQLYESVARSYISVLALEQDLRNLIEQKRIYSERIKDLIARTKRGESRPTEALTAQSTEAALDAEIKMTESSLVSERETLKFLTGLPADAGLSDNSLEKKNEKFAVKSLEDYLAHIEERPDIKSAREQIEATQEEIKMARGGHWPSLDLLGNYYVQRSEGYLSDMKWDVKLQLTFPLFEGGIVLSQTREATSRNREKELELNRLRKQAETSIRSLHEGLKNRTEQLAALQRSSELSEKSYQVVQSDFRRGLSRSIDVQLALTEFRMARRSYNQARFSAQLDWIKLQIASAQFPAAIMKEL